MKLKTEKISLISLSLCLSFTKATCKIWVFTAYSTFGMPSYFVSNYSKYCSHSLNLHDYYYFICMIIVVTINIIINNYYCINFPFCLLTLSWRRPLSYRNQSINLLMITASVMKELIVFVMKYIQILPFPKFLT